jgi:ribosomal protein S6
MEDETRLYELSYLLRGDISDEEALEKSESVRKTVENEKGLIIQENKPKKQSLGYPVKKHDIAYSGVIKFIFSPDKIPALKKSFEKSDILRMLLSQGKREEALKQPLKRRVIRRPAKEIQQTEGAQPKEPASTAKRGEPLQVEEIDKKLEEILGQ